MMVLLFLCILASVILYKYFTRNFNYWNDKGVNFIKPIFFFGNFKDVAFLRKSIGELLFDIYKESKAQMIGIWIFGTPQLIIRSPDIIKNILVKDFNYFHDRSITSDEKADYISSKMLLMVKNPEWKLLRSKFSPIFTSSKLKNMTELICEIGKKMQDYLHRHVGVLDAKELCAKYTIDVITSCGFGMNAHCFENENSEFRRVARKMMDAGIVNATRAISYFLLPDLVTLFKISFFDQSAIRFLRQVLFNTINERETSMQKRNDFIDILVNLKKQNNTDGVKFDHEDALAQATLFYVAGFESTSSTISFALYELCLQKDIQDKAREEIIAALEEYGKFSFDAVNNLKYIEKILLETLRKYPSLPFLDRRCVQDYKVPNSNVVIEKGTAVFISMLGLHYDPKYFPNPEKFDPDRFDEENITTRPEHAFLPFGHGPHNCIGARFGLIIAKICLAYILLDFQVEACSRTPKKIEYAATTFVLSPINGLPMNFKKIKKV